MFVQKPCPVCKKAVVNVVPLFDSIGKEEDKTEDKTGESVAACHDDDSVDSVSPHSLG